MTQDAVPLGSDKSSICTPALCLDLDLFQRNVGTMIDTCRQHDVHWRPHAKCHKSPEIGRRLVDAGACGLTCATLREAEVMAQAGISDLLVANMIAGPVKLSRLAGLTRVADPIVCVDDLRQAEAISAAMTAQQREVRVLIELEIGMNRVGIAPGEPTLRLARRLTELPGIQFAGLMAYEGHLLTVADPQEKESEIRRVLDVVLGCRKQIEAAGMQCSIVSCGGTGSYPITVSQPGITEIQAGGAVFMDAFYRQACHIEQLDHALTVLATVVSRPTAERAVIDAGRKALNIEIHRPQVVGKPGVTVDWLSAEHGVLKLTADAPQLEIGERIELIPGYADLTTMLHSCFWAFRGGRLEQIIPIVR